MILIEQYEAAKREYEAYGKTDHQEYKKIVDFLEKHKNESMR